MTFAEFFEDYAKRYQKGFPWVFDEIQVMISKGIVTFELVSDEVQNISRKYSIYWCENRVAKAMYFRTMRDLLIYILEDWVKLRDLQK